MKQICDVSGKRIKKRRLERGPDALLRRRLKISGKIPRKGLDYMEIRFKIGILRIRSRN